MFDPPISVIGAVIDSPKPNIYRVSLPNGKTAIGHVPKSQRDLHPLLVPDVRVKLELTPYDFTKARIVGLAEKSN